MSLPLQTPTTPTSQDGEGQVLMSPVGPPPNPTQDREGNLVPISPVGPPPSSTQEAVWNAALGVPDQGSQVPLVQNPEGDLAYIPMPREDQNNNG